MFTDDERQQADKRAAREEAARVRAAEKAKKAATASGAPLRVEVAGRAEVFKTERAARTWYVNQKVLASWSKHGDALTRDSAAAFDTIEQALAEKNGVPVANLQEDLAQAVERKRRRDGYA